jgi:hypothetical protein
MLALLLCNHSNVSMKPFPEIRIQQDQDVPSWLPAFWALEHRHLPYLFIFTVAKLIEVLRYKPEGRCSIPDEDTGFSIDLILPAAL